MAEQEERPEVRVVYSKIIEYVDAADQIIGAGLSSNRKRHWSQALKFWEITLLLLLNAKKLYESATGDLSFTPTTWKRSVRRVLGGLDANLNSKHL